MVTPVDRLARLYDGQAPKALGILVRLVGDRAWAEDILQEAFLRVSKHVHEVADDRALSAYLFRAATNLAIDGLRSGRRAVVAREAAARRLPESTNDGPVVASAEQRDLHEVVRRSLDLLPPRERAAVLLRVVVGLPLDEVGASLAVTDRAASRLVRLGLDRLRRRLSSSPAFSDLVPEESPREPLRP